MEHTKAIRVGIVALCVVAANTPVLADPLLSAQTTTFVLCASLDCEPRFRVPVSPRATLKASAMAVSLLDVRRDNAPDDVFKNVLHTKLEADANDVPKAIVVTADKTPMAAAGSYAIDILVTLTGGKESTTFTVTATRAAGQLETPSTLHIERVFYSPWSSAHKDTYAPLSLAQSTKASAVGVELSDFAPKQPTVNGTAAVKGELSLPKAIVVPEGRSVRADLTLTDDFPLGLNVGAVLVTSKQLAAPVTVNFDVRSRLSTWYILPIVAFGLIASWFVKVKLQGDIDRAAATLRARQLLEQIAAIRGRHLSRTLIDSPVADAETTLRQKLDDASADANAIEDTRKSLETAFQTAFNNLPGARAAVQMKVDALRGLTEAPWPGPPTVVVALRNALSELQRVAGMLQLDDIEKGNDELTAIKGRLNDTLVKAFESWRTSLSTRLRDLGRGGPGISTTVVNTTGPGMTAAADMLKSLDSINPQDDTLTLTTKLNSVIHARTLALNALTDAAHAIEQDADDGIVVLQASSAAQMDILAKLKLVASDVGSSFRRIADNPEAWGVQAGLLPALDESWRRAALSIAPSDRQAIVIEQLDKRQYLDAARAAIAAQATTQDVQNDDAPRPRLPMRSVIIRTSLASAADVVAAPSSTLFQVAPAADGFAGTSSAAVAADRLQRVKWQQTVIVGFLLTLLGYSMFEAKFVGIFDDWLTIFFWAFGLDLAVDTVLKLAKKP